MTPSFTNAIPQMSLSLVKLTFTTLQKDRSARHRTPGFLTHFFFFFSLTNSLVFLVLVRITIT